MAITGIYKIQNIISNDFYIGSSKNIKNRWSVHKHLLRENEHQNEYLQNAWNKYGKDSFILEIVEECSLDKEILLAREQYYIDTLTPKYNILLIAGSCLGCKQTISSVEKRAKSLTGKKCSDETKKKISEANKGKSKNKGIPKSDETKIKMSNSKKGKIFGEAHKQKLSDAAKNRVRHPCTDETKKKISDANKGKKRSEDTKKILSERQKGKLISEEHKKKISEANKGKKKPPRSQEHTNKIIESKRLKKALILKEKECL